MASERQIAANRANAAKSTGPKTSQGKAASSRNNLRHGLFASTVVFDAEDLARLNLLLANLQADFQPESILESALIETLAVTRWRQLRLRAIEKATLPNQLRRHKPDHSTSAAARLAGAVRAVRDEARLLDIISRLDARFDRHFNAAIERLLRIREEKAVFCSNSKPISSFDKTPVDEPRPAQQAPSRHILRPSTRPRQISGRRLHHPAITIRNLTRRQFQNAPNSAPATASPPPCRGFVCPPVAFRFQNANAPSPR